jgi:hypothetical protein
LRSPVAPEKLMKLCHKGLERFPMVKFETIWASKSIESWEITPYWIINKIIKISDLEKKCAWKEKRTGEKRSCPLCKNVS